MKTIEKLENDFGKTLIYKKGDIVVWGGHNPAIGRLAFDYDFTGVGTGSYNACAKFKGYERNEYNSLHFHNLRMATPTEKEVLGDNEMILIELSKTHTT